MALLDILACPRCRGTLVRDRESLVCERCRHSYPQEAGIPILLADSKDAASFHEGELGVRPGYARWKERLIIKSLPEQHPVLDFGAGRQALDDPCIVRMDLQPSPYIDVVGDVTNLPFRDDVFGFAFGGAVMEHVPDPAAAVRELYRVVRPGGYVYADWASTFAYHGYPHHYFNATLNGIRNAFSAFTVLECGVAPFHGPAFALRSVIGTYVEHFKPRTLRDWRFAAKLDALRWTPLERFDACFDPNDLFRTAAAVYVVAVKQPGGTDTVIPSEIMRVYSQEAALRARFPQPLNLAVPDNLMTWAKTDGARAHDAIRLALDGETPFSKHSDGRSHARPAVDSWPLELMDVADPLPTTTWRMGTVLGRPISVTVPYGRFKRGVIGTVRWWGRALWRWLAPAD